MVFYPRVRLSCLALVICCANWTQATEASKLPKIIDQVEKLNHPEGTNATFTCSLGSGELESLTYEWLKDDKRINQTSKWKITVLPENYNSVLRVVDLKPEDSGSYTCIARNQFGQDRITTRLVVKIQLKWLLEPQAEVKVSAGKMLHLPCKADGNPSPRIQWTKLGDQGPEVLGPELSFSPVRPQDAGMYECRASNGVEEDLVSRSRVEVLGK